MVVTRSGARRRRTLGLAVAALAAIALMGAAFASAIVTAGRPAATLFVDPFAAYSAIGLPGWDAPSPTIHFPDRVISVDGIPIGATLGYRDLPGARFDEIVRRRWDAGARHVSILFAEGNRTVSYVAPLSPINGHHLWMLVCVYVAMAACMAACGILVFVLARHRPGGRAYVFLSLVGFLFLTTFIDYHTTRWLVPIFLLAYGGNVIGIFWVAYTFPSPPLWSPASRAALQGAAALGGAATIWACVAPITGADPVRTRVLLSSGISLSLFTLAACTIVRWRRTAGRERELLASALAGLVVVPVIIAIGMAFSLLVPGQAMQALIPLGGFFIPLSVGYALIKHNVFDTNEVLTRRLVLAPLALLALAAAAVAWLLIDVIPSGPARFVHPALACAAVGVTVFLGLRRGTERFLFGAARAFRPTIEQLSDKLALLREPAAIGRTIESLVLQCINVRSARVLSPSELTEPFPTTRQWTNDDPDRRSLLLPMRSLGELRAILAVGPKPGGSLFSAEDLSLLDTLASLGAIALHNAEVVRQLDDLRHLERDVSRDDKRLTLNSLAAEISHEVQYPLNYFKFLLKQLASRSRLDVDEAEIGREEIERLERMLAALRKLNLGSLHALQVERVQLIQPIVRAITLLREKFEQQLVTHVIDVDPSLYLAADADSLLQVFINLLRNAAQATGARGRIGVRANRDRNAALTIDVWDDGPGVADELREAIFSPWVTTRSDGSGLGLPVALRIVRLHGWQLTLHREHATTIFRITVPVSALPPSSS